MEAFSKWHYVNLQATCRKGTAGEPTIYFALNYILFICIPRLNILINNAGISAPTTIQKTEMETFDQIFATNIRGVYNLTRLLVPALIKTKGNIVNVSSVIGSIPSVGSLSYSMSKVRSHHHKSSSVS